MNVELFKVILLYKSVIGKTSIITLFINETFQEDQQSTTGREFSTKSVICDGSKIL